jgi:hypothetical protein
MVLRRARKNLQRRLTVFFVDQIVPESALERAIYSRYDAFSVTGDGSGADA